MAAACERTADVCLILEGTYPYVAGGVSSWTHDLIRAQPDLSFYLVSLMPKHEERKPRYEVPSNVIAVDHTYIQEMTPGRRRIPHMDALFDQLEGPLERLQSEHGDLHDLRVALDLLLPWREALGGRILLNSRESWQMLLRMYERGQAESSFLDYFWSWRALMGGLFSILLGDLPPARLYHTVSTGYAGLMAARAALETGRPAIVTEHGIYTNERRIEIAMANWLFEGVGSGLNIGGTKRDLKDLWMDTFASYSRACYEACDHILTLYEGNQILQRDDGADPARMRIIPNGIDYDRFSAIPRSRSHPGEGGARPVIALIGRVVPIKDIKTFIRAAAMIREQVVDVDVRIIGPFDEDEEYFEECRELVRLLNLEGTVGFPGRMKLDDVLGEIDVQVLTSISEGMPLVILEAGAAGIPAVASDVGACRELIMGRSDEVPHLGPGGAITGLSNPRATAEECIRLLTDQAWYRRCASALKARVDRFYRKELQNSDYRAIYDSCMARPDRPRLGQPRLAAE